MHFEQKWSLLKGYWEVHGREPPWEGWRSRHTAKISRTMSKTMPENWPREEYFAPWFSPPSTGCRGLHCCQEVWFIASAASSSAALRTQPCSQHWPPKLDTSVVILTSKSKSNPHQYVAPFIQLLTCESQFCKLESNSWCWSHPSCRVGWRELSFLGSILGKWDPKSQKRPSCITGVQNVPAGQKTRQIHSTLSPKVLVYIIGQSFLLHRVVIRIKEGNLGEAA